MLAGYKWSGRYGFGEVFYICYVVARPLSSAILSDLANPVVGQIGSSSQRRRHSPATIFNFAYQ